MARQIEQTGKTISEAVEAAVKKLGVELSDIEYKVLSEGSRGFLGLGAKPAKVLVTVTGEDEAEEILEEVKIEEVAEEIKEPRKFFKKETTVVEKATEEVTEVVVKETVETEKVEAPVESSRASLTEEDKKIILGTATDFLKSISILWVWKLKLILLLKIISRYSLTLKVKKWVLLLVREDKLLIHFSILLTL